MYKHFFVLFLLSQIFVQTDYFIMIIEAYHVVLHYYHYFSHSLAPDKIPETCVMSQ